MAFCSTFATASPAPAQAIHGGMKGRAHHTEAASRIIQAPRLHLHLLGRIHVDPAG
ncbi:hypothetical protein BRADI_1g57804v3 [Brachypodium distachyon]|uniref:Uncharacterized protein n=1 Tax=Brachypodium distachyon TaxID=15368 RepID=A0A2K2DS47_BRADI|nr:hypothetical protein BRADI_1g57804v3 [Brachypodium distachyon]PNT77102.1 hypothetical protein BRADI_1g57804v3 [Brachypodium distachyon]